MAKIALFGGTFNPFHIGHYEILKALCESDMFIRVLLVPDRIPPHKDITYKVSNQDRIEMCRIVCEDFKKAQLCLLEFEREGKSYTFDTVSVLKSCYPSDEFYVVCGADMINSLDTWYKFDKLKDMVSFVAFERGNDQNFLSSIERLRSMGADIVVFENKITEVSSTAIRDNLKKEFLPEKVYNYVIKRGIYKQ